MTSTTLRWGPRDNSLSTLVDFQQRIAHYLDHARQHAAENRFYRQLVPFYEGELIRVSDQVIKRRRQTARRKAA
jgi:hypothetical protein